MRLKSIALNLLLALASVLFTLGALELVLRLQPSLMPEEAQLRIHWRQMADADTAKSRADPYLGYLYPAGARSNLYDQVCGFA